MYRITIILFLFALHINISIVSGQVEERSLSFINERSYVKIPSSTSLSPAKEITVACWIKPHKANWSNKPQTIVSKKAFGGIDQFGDMDNWELFDATNTSGENDVQGFVGAVFDGRYIYYSPWWKGGENPQSGKVLRYDTQEKYDSPDSWEVYDASNEDGEYGMRGLEGAVFDGRYVYFVPLHVDDNYSSKVLRYDSKGEFSDTNSWDVYDPASPTMNETAYFNYYDAKGFVGAVFDGQYIYFIPNPFIAHLKIVRYNTKAEFTDHAAWEVFKIHDTQSAGLINGFFGGIYDGRYIYFVPYNSNGSILRFDTTREFSDNDAWQVYNITYMLSPDFDTNFAGAVFDGRYIYFSPKVNGHVIRLDTKGDFSDINSWSSMYILNLDGEHSLNGGIGPTFDGRYIYFPPMFGKNGRSGKTIIYDTYKDFLSHSSWNYYDITSQDEQLAGFEGAVFDGQYIYFAPMNFDKPHGKMLRYNTTAHSGLSYSLVYNQTSSSFGSVIQRPTFQVGTEKGLRTISLKEDVNLADGQWHHITATYDGQSLKIYLNGQLNNETYYNTLAEILTNEADLAIGAEAGSINSFDGCINRVSIWNKALPEEALYKIFTCNCLSGDEEGLVGFWPFNEINEYNLDTVTDVTSFSNNGLLVNNPVYESTDTYIQVYAGVNEVVCSNDRAFMLKDFYPAGGVWSGNGVDQYGLFTPSTSLAGTTQKLVYTFTDNTNCTFSSIKYISIIPTTEQPVLTTNFAPSFCQGTFTILSVKGNYDHYEWSSGDTTSSIQVQMAGSYTVRVRNNGSCESILSQPAVIQVFPLPDIPVLSLTDITSLTALTPLPGNYEYEWERNGEKLMYTKESIKVLESANYRVRVKNDKGCYSNFSHSFYFNIENKSKALQNNIHLYPNPSSGIFNLEFSGLEDVVTISVYNIIGKKLYEATFAVEDTLHTTAINLSGFPKSIYIMNIQTRYGILQKKIITQ